MEDIIAKIKERFGIYEVAKALELDDFKRGYILGQLELLDEIESYIKEDNEF